MNELSGKENKTTLGDDGELHQILDDPASRRDAIFCVHCATPNLPGAKYCNECGRSLVEQQSHTPFSQNSDLGKWKNDHEKAPKLATYDPNLYELKLKPRVKLVGPVMFMSAALAIYILVGLILNLLTAPTECLLILVPIAIVAGAWWFVQRSMTKSG